MDQNLELMAMRWLRFERKCVIVMRERCPRWGNGNPDVIGITPARYVIEIEIKRSVSDFRANALKRHRINRNFYIERQPRWFYYLMPLALAEKLEPEIPEWAGLMHDGISRIGGGVIRAAPVNKLSQKLTIKECCKAVPLVVNHLISSETSRDNNRHRFIDGHNPWIPDGVTHYEI